MTRPDESDVALVEFELDRSADATGLRHLGRRAALLLGLDDVDATRVATAVSELSRLTQGHRPAQIRIAVVGIETDHAALSIAFRFDAARTSITTDTRVAAAVGRLMDTVEVTDDLITVVKWVPHAVASNRLTAIRDELLGASSVEHGASLQSVNDELVATLMALRERESELVTLNTELDQTNRGVVALYAELEERALEVRDAQRAVFEELENALRPPPPPVPGLRMDVRYLPAQKNSPTGGDLYDWFVLPDGCLQATVVDVRGHGVTSTRDALHVTHCVRTLALEGHQVGEVLSRADTILQASATTVVATVLLARIDPRTGVVQLVGAGHPPAARIPRDAAAAYVEAPGRALGYENGGSYLVATEQLEPGDTLLLYTDGLIEIRRDVIEGLATLLDSATTARALDVPQLLDSILLSCTHGAELTDDTLLLAIRWQPADR